MHPSHATVAEYFLIGLYTGLVTQDQVKAWAMSVIEQMPEPPSEIIDVSWSKTMATFEECLRAVVGERDRTLAGRWLLGTIRRLLAEDEDLRWCARKAQQGASATEMDESVYYEFDCLEDELFLAINNPGIDIGPHRKHLEEALEKYSVAPFRSET